MVGSSGQFSWHSVKYSKLCLRNNQEVQTGPLAAVQSDSTVDDPKQKNAVAAVFMYICFLSPVLSGE